MLWYDWTDAASCKFRSAEVKLYLIQRRKKEKLPVDIVPSSQDSTLDKGEQIVTVETDVTHDTTTDPKVDISLKTEARSSTKGVCIYSQECVGWQDQNLKSR